MAFSTEFLYSYMNTIHDKMKQLSFYREQETLIFMSNELCGAALFVTVEN